MIFRSDDENSFTFQRFSLFVVQGDNSTLWHVNVRFDNFESHASIFLGHLSEDNLFLVSTVEFLSGKILSDSSTHFISTFS